MAKSGKCHALLLGHSFLAGKKRMAQKVTFHQDNVQSHTSTVAVAQLRDFGLLLVPPALYNSRFKRAFAILKISLCSRKFSFGKDARWRCHCTFRCT